MAIDRQKWNAAYNLLKETVGEKGAFVVFATKPEDGAGEDMKMNTFGPITTLIGLMNLMTPYCSKILMARMDKIVKPGPTEPD